MMAFILPQPMRPVCDKLTQRFLQFCGWMGYIIRPFLQTIPMETHNKERKEMKATGIVRRVDDLGRIVIPKEIRRTLRIREGTPLLKTLTVWDQYLRAMEILQKRLGVHCK